ncbi:MAG: hypothetical protein WCV91_03540 [Candidatus Margulisiibacteriota bacterium]
MLTLFAIFLVSAESTLAQKFSGLLRSFRLQSFFLALLTLLAAYRSNSIELYFVGSLILIIKVLLIPHLFQTLIKGINVSDNLGLFVSPQLSLFSAGILGIVSWSFSNQIMHGTDLGQLIIGVSFFVMLVGIFLMISRIKALAQVIGLLMMENGVFLAATVIPGGAPFFIEIAVFFDILVSAMILGLFIYRIKAIFTHIDISKLSGLKG